MAGFLEVLLGAYGVNVKSYRQLRGGTKLLELFSISATNSPQDNFRRLKAHLRNFFPQIEGSLCVGKCARGERLELCYVAALSVGALIAQDLSKASSSLDQSLPERLRNLCAYQGAEVDSIKEFCEIVFRDENVPNKIKQLLSTWMENTENDVSTSSGSSLNSSVASIHSRAPLSPLNAVLRTPENRLRVREKYNQEVVKLRGDLLIMRERYDHLEADMKQQADTKDRELKELQNRVRFLREIIDSESEESRNNAPAVQNEVSAGRLKMLQKQVQQLQEFEQKFFDEKLRAEELETKLVQDEKKIKDLKARIQILEATIFERDEELSQAADEMSALRDRLEEQRINISLVRHRSRSHDTLDSVPDGENLGDAVQDLIVAELRTNSDQLRDELETAKNELATKNMEVADLQLSNQMKREQVGELEVQVEALRAQIRSHIETITQAANQANELSTKLQSAQSESERLRYELGSMTEVKQKLEERRKYLENKVHLLKAQIDETQSKFNEMDRIKSLIEEQLKAQNTLIDDLRSQVAEKTARISCVEAELSKATSSFTETLKSMNAQLSDDRKIHSEEKAKMERRITTLEQDLNDTNLQRQTLCSEIEKLKIERAEIHTQLNIQLETQSKMKREISMLEETLRLEVEARQTFETSFKQAVAEVNNFKVVNEQLKIEVEQLRSSERSMKEHLEQDQQSLIETRENLKVLEEKHRDMKKTYIANSTQLEEMRELLETRKGENAELREIQGKLQTTVEEQAREKAALEAEISELKDALASEAADKLFMEDALKQASATISEKDSFISSQNAILTQMESEVQTLKSQLTTRDQQWSESNEAQEQLRKEADSAKAALERLESQTALREKDLEDSVKELQELLEGSKKSLHAYEEQIESLTQSTEILHKERALQIEAEARNESELRRLQNLLDACNIDLGAKKSELEAALSEFESKSNESKDAYEQEIRTLVERVSALENREKDLELELEQSREKSREDGLRIAGLSEKIAAQEKELQTGSEEAEEAAKQLERERTTLQEAISRAETEIKDLRDEMNRLANKLKEESNEKEKLAVELDALKAEQASMVAELSELRSRESSRAAGDVELWRNFRRSLVDKLEHVDVQAPVMNDDELLGVVDRALENQRKVKELQIENQSLSRSVRNAEDNIRCRIVELTSDNDQLKRKLREASSELNRCQDELKEITATVIRAKNGDTIDGGILSSLCRDILNMAVTSQDNATTKKEVTELRLALSKSCRDTERLQAQVEQLQKAKDELQRVREERDQMMEQLRIHRENEQLGIHSEKQHEATMELVKEGYDLEVERLRSELQRSTNDLARTRSELKNTQEYVSTLLEKYDKTKEYSLKKISGLHDIIYQNNIPLPRARRKSPNQTGLPISSRHSDTSADDVERKLREKDEEIRRLRLAKSELEKRVCAATVNERMAAGISDLNSSRAYTSMLDIERQRMPPPPPPSGDYLRDHYSCVDDDRAWKEFREPCKFSASICSDYDSFSVKSMPAMYHQDRNPMQRSFSTRSLLFDHDTSRSSQRPHASHLLLRSSTCSHRGASCLSSSKFVPHEEDFPSPPAMYDKPLPTHTDPKLSNTFESINDLNYKCRGGRSVGLGGLGLGDDEEAQFMNPKNLEELKNGGPKTPPDSHRSSILKQRNSQVPPHLRSSYPVETQNGKIPVTPLLQKKRLP
ncbi:myosin-10 [Galendromus occidentalis]|uniref:Myosin-10 n=1 Tax=Galendromus occidentalis TaxID=34638 RepID=A0AAJ6QTA7_9ACAR|nr:myosin-10 [Galendromus occidentalis]